MTTASQLLDSVLKRIRQHGGVAVTEAEGLSILSTAQNAVNFYIRRVVATTTISTLPYLNIYSLRSALPSASAINQITEATRCLHWVPRKELPSYNQNWFRTTGTQFEVWTTFGVDMLGIFPARLVASSVSVLYTVNIVELTSADEAITLSADDEEGLILYSILLLALRGRQYELLKPTLDEFKRFLAGYPSFPRNLV